jgi:hypothetical protein
MEETRTPKTGRDRRIFLTLDLDQIPGAGQTDALNKPVLTFELSPWDARVTSSEGIKRKFDQFFETHF